MWLVNTSPSNQHPATEAGCGLGNYISICQIFYFCCCYFYFTCVLLFCCCVVLVVFISRLLPLLQASEFWRRCKASTQAKNSKVINSFYYFVLFLLGLVYFFYNNLFRWCFIPILFAFMITSPLWTTSESSQFSCEITKKTNKQKPAPGDSPCPLLSSKGKHLNQESRGAAISPTCLMRRQRS